MVIKAINETDCIFFQCERLMGGMEKLAEASVQLEELNKLLVVQKKAVEGI